MEPPRNRKQRRAVATASHANSSFDPTSIPLAHPPRDTLPNIKSNGKTLIDIISERQNEILGHDKASGTAGSKSVLETQFVTVDPSSGKISRFDPSNKSGGREIDSTKGSLSAEETQSEEDVPETDAPIPPLIDTLLLSIPLTTLHLTLAYLAAHQYAQIIELDKLIRESAFVAFPMLTLLIHLAHGHIVSLNKGTTKKETISLFPWSQDKLSLSFLRKLLFPPSLRTLVFLPLAVFLGTKLMIMTNEDTYYAVMKQAPAIGTMWVWSILEIPVGAAVLGALGPLLWGTLWKGYGII